MFYIERDFVLHLTVHVINIYRVTDGSRTV